MKIRRKNVDITIKGERISGNLTKGQFTKLVMKAIGDKEIGKTQANFLWTYGPLHRAGEVPDLGVVTR